MSKIDFSRDAYIEARTSFRIAVEQAVSISVSINGVKSNSGREYWSSVIFSKLVLSAMTLDKIAPINPNENSVELWDLGSICTLARGLAENYLILHWLCFETAEKELWDLRITLLTLCDNRSRFRLVDEVEGEPASDCFEQAQLNVSKDLSKNPIFASYDEKRKRALIKADKLPFIHDEVIASLPIDPVLFRKFYRYLSAFVHTNTISFFRMAEQNRGSGEFNHYDANNIAGALDLVTLAISGAVKGMRSVHAYSEHDVEGSF